MSEDVLVRELERRARQVDSTPLRFEDVRRSAHRIQRRRRAAAAGAVAAAVVAAILVPTALTGGSPKSAGPEPAPPAPTIRPGETVRYDLDATPGDPPAVLYQRPADDVLVAPDGEHQLPEDTAQVVPYGDGFLAVAPGANPTSSNFALYQLDADYDVVGDLGPVGQQIVASPDGRRVAWIEVALKEPAFLVVAEDGEIVQRLPLPEGNLGSPVGFTADGTVYSFQMRDVDTPTWEEAVGDERAPVPHLSYVRDASPVSDLVVGTTRFQEEENLPCAGAVSGSDPESELLWEKCWYLLEDLSPDGSLVIGYPDEPTPSHRRLTVLDARTGETVVEYDGGRRASVVEAAWEDDNHILAVVQQGDQQAILRLGLDGSVERATDPVTVRTLSVAWFLAGRPFE